MKKWTFRTSPDGSKPTPGLADELAISPILLKILWNRGLCSAHAINDYLSPSLKNLTQPALWPHIPRAAKIIAEALTSGKKLAIWGDYDVDGITATALTLDVLEHHGFKPLYHLPDRLKEGYGLNKEYIKELAKLGCEVLLTVDCGISDVEAIAFAESCGIKVIVSDHHLPPEELPSAEIFVNPRMKGNWPCKNLAGVGVAFYLMAGVNALLAPITGKRYRMDNVLDLAALGTLADVMELEGQNRIIATAGIRHMDRPSRPGIAALKIASGFALGASLNSTQTVFCLAPRLNAAGRMGHPDLALNLLRSTDYLQARELADQLEVCNNLRKTEENRMYKEAREQAYDLLEKHDYRGLVLYGADWHPGIVGIVASRIVEEFNRPAIVLCEDNGYYKGSGRSLPEFDLYLGLRNAASELISFGGHKQAAGVRLAPENLGRFRVKFSNAVRGILGEGIYTPTLVLEGELPFCNAANEKLINEINFMQPFGQGNPEPIFASLPVEIIERRLLGPSGNHVQLTLRELDSGRELKAKAWRRAKEFTDDVMKRPIRIAYTPQLDFFNGIANIDLSIKDWQKI